MHRITPTIRRILPTDIPVVTPVGGDARPANDQELLNMGIVSLGAGDLYSCIHQEQTDENGVWQLIDAPHPGEELASGPLSKRYNALAQEDRDAVMQALVVTLDDVQAKVSTATSMAVAAVDVQPVVSTNLLPHSWSGERR